MNKQAFNARARVARVIARLAKAEKNAWVYAQAKQYARTGWVGPDLVGWLDWYWGRREDCPETPLGALAAWSRA